jgi:hypothetical protein
MEAPEIRLEPTRRSLIAGVRARYPRHTEKNLDPFFATRLEFLCHLGRKIGHHGLPWIVKVITFPAPDVANIEKPLDLVFG